MTFNDFVRENLYHFYQNDEFIKEYDNIISIPNIKEYIQLPSLIVDENLQHEDFNKLTIKKLDEILQTSVLNLLSSSSICDQYFVTIFFISCKSLV